MIAVLADDLSGAAEVAGVAVRHGLSAEVQTAFNPATDAEVICVATDTRSWTADDAGSKVAAVTEQLVAARPAWMFKKCDSILRGPVLAEARAMARTAGQSRILILPANPSRDRIIRDGCYFIGRQPLHETAFADDPVHPRRTSRVVELLGGDLTGVATPDACAGADLVRCAASITEDTLPVGAADFFAALLQSRVPARAVVSPAVTAPAGPTLVVCGSAASWMQRRTEALARGVPVFGLPHDVATIVSALQSTRRALMGVGDGPDTRGQSPATLVLQLAQTVAGVLREATVARLLLEGGATAAAVVQALGWSRLRVTEASTEVGALQPVNAGGPRLYIKPGSYAWPPEIWP